MRMVAGTTLKSLNDDIYKYRHRDESTPLLFGGWTALLDASRVLELVIKLLLLLDSEGGIIKEPEMLYLYSRWLRLLLLLHDTSCTSINEELVVNNVTRYDRDP